MGRLNALTEVLDGLEPHIPSEGPRKGQRALLERLLGYRSGTPEELDRIRRMLTSEDTTPTSTTNREDTE